MKKQNSIQICIFLILCLLSACKKKEDDKNNQNITRSKVNIENVSSKIVDSVKNNIGYISSYLLEEDIELANNNPVFLSNKLVLYINGEDVIGYYGWVAQNSVEYYLQGKKNGNLITGKKYSFDDGNINSEFSLSILPNSIKTNNLSSDGQLTIPTSKIDFFIENAKSIYELPNRKSKILASNYILDNKKFKLVEIGKFEKIEGEYEIWYKIKNKDFEGWVFGLISDLYAD